MDAMDETTDPVWLWNSINTGANALKPVLSIRRQKGSGETAQMLHSYFLTLINSRISLSGKLLHLHLC